MPKTSLGRNKCSKAPARNSVVARRHLGYTFLAENLEQLKKFDFVLPSNFPVSLLDEGNGIENTLVSHECCVAQIML